MVKYSKLTEEKPQYLIDIELEIEKVKSQKFAAVMNQNFELAVKLRKTERELNEKLKPIKVQWEADYLRNLTLQKAISRYGNPIPSEILKRIELELDTIKTKGSSGNFLIAQDIIQTAQDMGVIVGPGRGSSAGSVVNYCLGITAIDPVKYDLLFERFNDHFEIYIDFDVSGREKILHWVTEKYEKEIDSADNLFVTFRESSISIHFLGFEILSVIKKTLSNIKQSKEIDLDISEIPMDDAKIFELYSRGDTEGIFQFESHGMQRFLQALQPVKLEDLSALSALYRPDSMDYIPDFIDRKQGRKEIIYDFPKMGSRLKDTYGIYVYQEQIMLLSQDLAGFTPEQSNKMRIAMSKKQPDKLEELKLKFIDGATKNGFAPKEKLEKIWADWEEVSSFLFNKSHAVSYTIISYQSAYLKAHFPEEFEEA